MAQWKKSLPAVRGELCLTPGLGRPQGKEMADHSSIPAWRIPWTEESDGLQSMGVTKSQT